MKRLKKIMSVLLTAIMVLAMCVPVMATGEGSGSTPVTYEIKAPATVHQYEIYQIFTGKLKEENKTKVLSDIKWGSNGNFPEGATVGTTVAENVINSLLALNEGKKTDKEKLEVITQYANLTSTPVATITNGQSYWAEAGYYLIKDKDNSIATDANDAYTTYIVEVVGKVDITPKADVPSFEKKVKDTNDSTGDTSNWQDSADYDIGDAVPFKLEGTVTSKYDDYETYYFAFHDVEEKGLTFNSDSVHVFIDGKKITEGYRLETNPTDGCSFEVVFDNLKLTAARANSKITVEYTSTLNSDAVLGQNGNVNKARLEFSNNPNSDQGGTGKTPWDNVIVFTYKVVVNKYANSVADGNKLTGAEFTLEKVAKDGTKTTIGVVKSEDGTSFTFVGLDDGNYVLTETKTPEGYNTIEPINFTVSATHGDKWESGDRNGILTELSGNVATGEITFSPLTENSSMTGLSTNVINKSGSQLPETGGIGTTIFYVVGVVLMLGAGVLLITKRRMNANH